MGVGVSHVVLSYEVLSHGVLDHRAEPCRGEQEGAELCRGEKRELSQVGVRSGS